MTQIKSIVWNGCDSYEFGNKSIFTQKEEFKPFLAIEINESELPIIDDEICYDGVCGVVGGKGWQYFKAV
jgi:hypothetical protein